MLMFSMDSRSTYHMLVVKAYLQRMERFCLFHCGDMLQGTRGSLKNKIFDRRLVDAGSRGEGKD